MATMSTMANNTSGPGMGAQTSSGIELPPGFRFHPTDEELVSFYLTRKINEPSLPLDLAIAEVDLNTCEPWDLPEKAKIGEAEWYVYSQPARKSSAGMRTNRATEKGYWKITGKDRDVMHIRTNTRVGMKKTLVFYSGRGPKGQKTNWVMHEYRRLQILHQNPLLYKEDEWVVCRIFRKSAGSKDNFNFSHTDLTHSGDCAGLPDRHLNHVSLDLSITNIANDSCFNSQVGPIQLEASATAMVTAQGESVTPSLPWVLWTDLEANNLGSVPMGTNPYIPMGTIPYIAINDLIYPFDEPLSMDINNMTNNAPLSMYIHNFVDDPIYDLLDDLT